MNMLIKVTTFTILRAASLSKPVITVPMRSESATTTTSTTTTNTTTTAAALIYSALFFLLLSYPTPLFYYSPKLGIKGIPLCATVAYVVLARGIVVYNNARFTLDTYDISWWEVT